MQTSQDKLSTVADRLSDLEATFEYPGFVQIEHRGLCFNFGDANDDFGYDVFVIGTGKPVDGPQLTLPLSASVDELESYIRKVMALTSGQYHLSFQ